VSFFLAHIEIFFFILIQSFLFNLFLSSIAIADVSLLRLLLKLPEPALDALCDTIWADATPLLHIASSASMQRRSSSPSLTLEPEEVLVNLDGFMERVLTAWLSVKLLSSSFGVQRRKNGLTGGNGAPEYQDYERDVSNDRMTHEQQQIKQQQLQRQKQADKAAVAAAAAHEEAVRLANQERAAKKKALEELALGEKIEYEEASAVAFDWVRNCERWEVCSFRLLFLPSWFIFRE